MALATNASEKLFRFIESEAFASRRDELGITNDDLLGLMLEISNNPEIGDVIRGANGIRKVRFAKSGSGRGKSGAFRVLYLCIRHKGVVFFVTVFAKSEKGNISTAEANALAIAAGRLKEQIERGFVK